MGLKAALSNSSAKSSAILIESNSIMTPLKTQRSAGFNHCATSQKVQMETSKSKAFEVKEDKGKQSRTCPGFCFVYVCSCKWVKNCLGIFFFYVWGFFFGFRFGRVFLLFSFVLHWIFLDFLDFCVFFQLVFCVKLLVLISFLHFSLFFIDFSLFLQSVLRVFQRVVFVDHCSLIMNGFGFGRVFLLFSFVIFFHFLQFFVFFSIGFVCYSIGFHACFSLFLVFALGCRAYSSLLPISP